MVRQQICEMLQSCEANMVSVCLSTLPFDLRRNYNIMLIRWCALKVNNIQGAPSRKWGNERGIRGLSDLTHAPPCWQVEVQESLDLSLVFWYLISHREIISLVWACFLWLHMGMQESSNKMLESNFWNNSSTFLDWGAIPVNWGRLSSLFLHLFS